MGLSFRSRVIKDVSALALQTTDATVLVAARDVEFGGTVLHWAAAAGDEEIVRLLLLKGADTRVRGRCYDASTGELA